VVLVPHRVKERRAYDSSGRRAEAHLRRKAVLGSARELFTENGFAATTVTEVASASGVSPETIYKAYGGKAGLVRALYAVALEGDGDVAAEQRSEELRASANAREVVTGWSRLAMEVAPKVSSLQLLVRDAALVDPSLHDLLTELDDARHRRMTENAEFLRATGHLRRGVTLHAAADLLWSVSSPEMFELLVSRRGWSLETYAAFVDSTIAHGLLEPA
jgi:AcrR family transcriptional regulator